MRAAAQPHRHSVGKMPDSVLQLDSAAADRNTETVSANSAAGWRRFLACLDSLLAGVDACRSCKTAHDACDLAALQFI